MGEEAAPPSVAFRFRRAWVPALPAAFSLGLSLSTVGADVYWQDSGFYLTAVWDLSVLYPPGFIVYQVLCKLWTLMLFFIDFTLAVHLFSAACAAAAAGALARAARDLLLTRRGPFRVAEPPSDLVADACAAAIGCLAASGFTFWFSGIYAKGYSFYFLILSLLLGRMIRAAEGGKPRDFTVLAVLIGLAWQAHPSSALLGPALLLFVGATWKPLGVKGLLGRIGVAAATALGPTLLLPILASRRALTSFGDPGSTEELVAYLAGSRFTSIPGVFGWDATRVSSVGQFLWEEMLGVGLALMTAGLIRIGLANSRLLLGLLAWIVPVLLVTVLFKIEGQHDFWFVAAWLPLYLAGAVGLADLARRAGRRAVPVAWGAAALGVLWAVLLNYPLLNLRGYDLASRFGRVYLDGLEPDAALVATSDEGGAICQYLVYVRGHRPDVLVIRASRLGRGRPDPGWYDHALKAKDERFRLADHDSVRRRFPRLPSHAAAAAAFVQANVTAGRPLYLEEPIPPALVPVGYELIPAGTLWKVVPAGRGRFDPRAWEFPVSEEEVVARFGRNRGQTVEILPDDVRVRPEPYERRLLLVLLRARKFRADWLKRRGDPAGARKDYEAILRFDPNAAELEDVVFPLGECCLALKDHRAAAGWFGRTLELDPTPRVRASAHLYLGLMLRSAGNETGAQEEFRKARSVEGLDPAFLREIERRAGSK